MSKEAMNHAIDVLRDSQDYKMGRAMTVEAVEFLEEALAKQEQGEPVALKVYRGELCYKSQADDQSFGMWCPVTQDLPFPEGTNFYTTSQPKQEQGEPVALETVYETIIHWDEGGGKRSRRELARRIEALYTTPQPKQEHCEPCGHGGRPMTLRECMEAEEPQQWRGFTYAQIKEHAEGIQRDYDLLLAEYNLLKQEQRSVSEQLGEPVAWCRYEDGMWVYYETKAWDDLQPLYTTPPQRTWVGLDWSDLPEEWVGNLFFKQGARWAEAKLKEKNA